MNAFDYFFENTSQLDKDFLVGKETISYRDLYGSCLNLAEWIEEKVGQDKHILLLSVNNIFFLKVYLAVIKSGNIVIPLDPNIEKDNYKYIHDLTNPELIFLTRDVDKKLNLESSNLIFPDTLTTHHSTLTSHHSPLTSHLSPLDPFDKERCAEIIFTSGSTGKPKGVMISHKNLIANTSSIVEYLKLTADDRCLLFYLSIIVTDYHCCIHT